MQLCNRKSVRLRLLTLETRVNPSCDVGEFTNVPDPDENPFDESKLEASLRAALHRFTASVAKEGGAIDPNSLSGYRPPEYQQHLRDIFDKYTALVNEGATPDMDHHRLDATPGTPSADCQDIIEAVNAEIAHHSLAFPPRVNRPKDSAHSLFPSEAFDATVTGLTSETIDRLACNAGLYRPYVNLGTSEGKIHYELLPSGTDLVLVIDTTGSMEDDIEAVKASATERVNQIFEGTDSLNCPRVAIVLYKDQGDSYVTQTALPFSEDKAEIVTAINAITVGGGGDTPEAVYSGLIHAIDNQQGIGEWRGGHVQKRVIAMGDAPPHDPESGTGYTSATVAAHALAVDPADIYMIAIGDDPDTIAAFRSIAEQNRGQFFQTADASTLSETMAAAITVAIPKPPPTILSQIKARYAVGAGPGGLPIVRAFDDFEGFELANFNAFDESFRGGVRTAIGDINADGISDVIVAAGPGGGPHVKVFDGLTFGEIKSFFAFDAGFHGGVYIASADVNGDGFADIVTGAGAGGGPHVKVFSGKDGSLLSEFFAYDKAFRGGVSVAVGDVTGDGVPEIVTGAGPGGGPHVVAYDIAGSHRAASFYAFDPGFTGGVNVAVGDVDGDHIDDIVTAAGPGGGPHVVIYRGDTFTRLSSFYAFDAGFTGGVSAGIVDRQGDGVAELLVGAGPGGGPHVRLLTAATLSDLDSFYAFDPLFLGGVQVG